jgi:hypothetical protein
MLPCTVPVHHTYNIFGQFSQLSGVSAPIYSYTASCVCVLPAAKHGLTLEDVRQLVERHHSIELPGFSPYSAVQELVSRHQVAWAAAAADCVAAAHRQLLHLVMLHISRTCSRFPAAAEHIRWAPLWQ